MFFPKLKDIATTEIVTVSSDLTVAEAMPLLYKTRHNFLVVQKEEGFYALTINQIFQAIDIDNRPDQPLSELTLRPIPSFFKEASILEALERLHFNFQEILALDDRGEPFGILTFTDIITSIDPETFMGSFRLSHILQITRRIPWLKPDLSTRRVLDLMERGNHSSMLLVEQRRPQGIVTSKDMLRLVMEKRDLERPISEYMSRPVLTLPHDSTISQTLEFLQKHQFKRAVTVDEKGEIYGVFTQREIIAFTYHRWMQILKEQQEKLDQINKTLVRQNLEFEKSSGLDPLTGLYNRLKCRELFISEYTVMLQRRNMMSLIMMDLDYFKSINDRYGHNTGDRVLEAISTILKNNLRKVDIACRWGGEEFLILLPATGPQGALNRAKSFQEAIAKVKIGETSLSLSASFGITEVYPGLSLEEAVDRADRALYQAKDRGRNQIVLFQETSDASS